MECSRSGLSIAASPASLRLLVRELGRGAEYAPPPAGRVRLNTPAGRGLIQAENALEVFRYILIFSAPQHSHTTTTRRSALHKVTRTTNCRSRGPAPYIGPQTISRTFLIIPENSETLYRRPFLGRSGQHENSREAARHFRNVPNCAVYRKSRAAESESEPESESVGVGCFPRSRSRSRSRQNLPTPSDSGQALIPDSQKSPC